MCETGNGTMVVLTNLVFFGSDGRFCPLASEEAMLTPRNRVPRSLTCALLGEGCPEETDTCDDERVSVFGDLRLCCRVFIEGEVGWLRNDCALSEVRLAVLGSKSGPKRLPRNDSFSCKSSVACGFKAPLLGLLMLGREDAIWSALNVLTGASRVSRDPCVVSCLVRSSSCIAIVPREKPNANSSL